MANCTSDDLWRNFESMGIEFGNIGKHVVDGWFETDCEETKKFLSFLCLQVNNSDNILSPEEELAYEELVKNGEVLTGEEYENAVRDLHEQYPDLMDSEEDLKIQIQCLSEEINLCEDEIKKQEQLMSINEQLGAKFSLKLNNAVQEQYESNAEKEAAHNSCIELCHELEDVQKKLYNSMVKYCDRLTMFEHDANPSFISNIPQVNLDACYYSILSHVEYFKKMEHSVVSKDSLNLSGNSSHCIESSFNKQLGTLQNRIFKSTSNLVNSCIKEKQIQAQVRYMQELNVHDVMCKSNASLQFQLEASILSKKNLMDRYRLDTEIEVRRYADSFINEIMLNTTQAEVKAYKKKLDYLSSQDSIFTTNLSFYILLYILLAKENEAFKNTEVVFKKGHHYINYELESCVNRIDLMINALNEFNLYKAAPLENHHKILKYIHEILAPDADELTIPSLLKTMKSFESDYDAAVKKAFADDICKYDVHCKEITDYTCELLDFVNSRTVRQPSVLPYKLIEMFNAVKSVMTVSGEKLAAAMQIQRNAKKKISSNKWFKIQRLLWIYFLTESEKVERYVAEIQAEVQKKRKAEYEKFFES